MKEKALLVLLLLLVAGSCAEEVRPAGEYLAEGEINSISFSSGLIAAGSEDSSVYLLDRYLDLKWTYWSNDAVKSVCLMDSGLVFGSADNRIVALDLEKNILWEADLESYIEYSHAISCQGEYVAAGTRDGQLYILDWGGNILWQEKLDAYILYVESTPDGVLAVSDRGVYMYSVSGDLIFSKKLESYARTAHIGDGYVAVGLGDNSLELYGPGGEKMFSKEQEDQIGSVCVSGDRVIAGLRNNKVVAYDLSGSELWDKKLSAPVMAVSADNSYVLVSTLDANINMYSSGGVKKWGYESEGRSPELLVSSLGLYGGSTRGEIYYFRAARDISSTIFVLSMLVVVILASFLLLLKTLR